MNATTKVSIILKLRSDTLDANPVLAFPTNYMDKKRILEVLNPLYDLYKNNEPLFTLDLDVEVDLTVPYHHFSVLLKVSKTEVDAAPVLTAEAMEVYDSETLAKSISNLLNRENVLSDTRSYQVVTFAGKLD